MESPTLTHGNPNPNPNPWASPLKPVACDETQRWVGELVIARLDGLCACGARWGPESNALECAFWRALWLLVLSAFSSASVCDDLAGARQPRARRTCALSSLHVRCIWRALWWHVLSAFSSAQTVMRISTHAIYVEEWAEGASRQR